MIDRSVVHRNLDSKIKILGMELFDVIAVGAFASVMNLIFGQIYGQVHGQTYGQAYSHVYDQAYSQSLYSQNLNLFTGALVFGLPALLALGIYFGKRGKPERYIQDFIKFSVLPGIFCVGDELSFEEERRHEIVSSSEHR